jgi:NAD(P)-dependent dehydrogenase (short-subunit alcohol dehydrogenase family)
MAMDMFSLAGRTALIAGAAGGIGQATAKLLAGLGAELVLCDREAPMLLAESLAHAGVAVAAVACDVSVRSEVEAVVAGCARIDAAIFTAALCPWDDWRSPGWDAAFDRVIEVNLKGAIDFSRAVMAQMAGRGGRLVLVSSLAGRSGGLIASPHYVASKGGLNALIKWLARQGAPAGILVNGVAPASVKTPMMEGQPVELDKIPLGRMAEPEEVAGPIAFLCMPAASYMTGTILDVNGGVYMG